MKTIPRVFFLLLFTIGMFSSCDTVSSTSATTRPTGIPGVTFTAQLSPSGNYTWLYANNATTNYMTFFVTVADYPVPNDLNAMAAKGMVEPALIHPLNANISIGSLKPSQFYHLWVYQGQWTITNGAIVPLP